MPTLDQASSTPTRSWLPGVADGADGWSSVAAMFPTVFGPLERVQRTYWDHVDPEGFELCRLRMAMLLGAEGDQRLRGRVLASESLEHKIDALAQYDSSPLFTDGERACIALSEQFVLDVQGVTDAQVAAVLAALGPEGTYAFVSALWSFEALQRICLVLGIEPSQATIGASTDQNEET